MCSDRVWLTNQDRGGQANIAPGSVLDGDDKMDASGYGA